MDRYSVINEKRPREIVLLKSKPCIWGKCSFCDYIDDNSADEEAIDKLNSCVLAQVTGIYKELEIINSASAFELTPKTLELIKKTCSEKGIEKLWFETHYLYKNKLDSIRNYFQIPVFFKCGIETFDDNFRNDILKKGVFFENPKEVAEIMDSVCIMVGIKGQTKDMIKRDIEILENNFKFGCVNVYVNNSTQIKADTELIRWFEENYSYLNGKENIDVLWSNTDFGVGGNN